MTFSEAVIPESHWDMLQEREQLHAQGLGQALPLEEAFLQIRAALHRDKALRVEGENGQWDAIALPWELLEKRKAALEKGESRAIPLEEVADSLRARRAARP